jgi:uncharacterized SAM-binding protein YcdF (DUF218 family)
MGTIKRILSAITLRRVLAALSVVLALWLLVVVGMAAAIYVYGEDQHNTSADVIIVLGAGLRRNGSPGDALTRRSLWAAQLYHEGAAPAVLCTGGTGAGQRRSEADACRELLQSRDVPATAIYLEDSSHSTEENAIYSRRIADALGWQRAILVTDSYHMLRASWTFNQYGIDHARSPVPREQIRGGWYPRHFAREILALHWYGFKFALNLSYTTTRR